MSLIFNMIGEAADKIENVVGSAKDKRDKEIDTQIEKLQKSVDKDENLYNYLQEKIIEIEQLEDDTVIIPLYGEIPKDQAVSIIMDKMNEISDQMQKKLNAINYGESLKSNIDNNEIFQWMDNVQNYLDNPITIDLDIAASGVEEILDDLDLPNIPDLPDPEDWWDNIKKTLEELGIGAIVLLSIGGYLIYKNRNTIAKIIPDEVNLAVI